MQAEKRGLIGAGFTVEDLPDELPTVPELIERRRLEFARRHKAKQARKLIGVNVNVEGPYAICHFGDPHCLTEDHEVLTTRGWLKHNDLDPSDKVGGLDDRGRFAWQDIKAIIRRETDEEIAEVNTQSLSLACTLHHRVIAGVAMGGPTRGYKPYGAVLAGDLSASQWAIPTAAWSYGDEYPIPDDWLRLCAWILTDAHWGKDTISIYQSKPDGVAAIDALVSRLELDVSRYERQRVNGDRNYNFPSVEWRLSNKCGALVKEILGMPVRKLPGWIWSLSRRQFDVFLDTAIQADGERPSPNCARIYKGLHFLDEMQAVASAYGYRTSLTEKGDWGVLSLVDQSYAVVKPGRDISRRRYVGTIWCVSVPFRQFFTRRNGRVHLTGNCDDPGTDISLLEKHVNIVANTKAMFAGNIGDMNNNWVGRLERLHKEQSTTAREAWALVEWLLTAMPWLYVTLGNHDAWSGDRSPLEYILRKNPGAQGAWGTRLELRPPKGTKTRVNARHDFHGHSMWNTVHGPTKAAKMGWRDHILVCGHKHTSGYALEKDPATGLVSHILRVASYKVDDAYAEELGLPDQAIFPAAVTIIDPAEPEDSVRHITVIADVEHGADYLTWLRNKRGC
jgi:hypothetical protein